MRRPILTDSIGVMWGGVKSCTPDWLDRLGSTMLLDVIRTLHRRACDFRYGIKSGESMEDETVYLQPPKALHNEA
jgi:hypothetical protein